MLSAYLTFVQKIPARIYKLFIVPPVFAMSAAQVGGLPN